MPSSPLSPSFPELLKPNPLVGTHFGAVTPEVEQLLASHRLQLGNVIINAEVVASTTKRFN
jgi:hypothetical protein